jgi:restriction system protein
MLPVLLRCAEKVWHVRDLVARIASDLQLTETEKSEQIPSGSETVIGSRVQWAKTYLKQAGLVEQPKRAFVTISALGREVLRDNPDQITLTTLMKFESFRSFLNRTKADGTSAAPASGKEEIARSGSAPINPEPHSTPEEQITAAARALEISLRDVLLARILESSPAFFERMIVDLLIAMGYGGSKADAGQQLGGTGDGGVDGVIREDQLGLDRIFLQAKRYQPGNNVSSESVQAFMGALMSKGAQKGVFITTSSFTKAALQVGNQYSGLRIVLIDGEELTRLLTQFNVGVRVGHSVEIKRLDLDYFDVTEGE